MPTAAIVGRVNDFGGWHQTARASPRRRAIWSWTNGDPFRTRPGKIDGAIIAGLVEGVGLSAQTSHPLEIIDYVIEYATTGGQNGGQSEFGFPVPPRALSLPVFDSHWRIRTTGQHEVTADAQ